VKCLIFSFLLLSENAGADTLRVVIGDAGCIGRQITIRNCWKNLPGVKSVEVLRREPGSKGGQRVFLITSESAPPTENQLREALGRRAKNFPILSCSDDMAAPTSRVHPAG
jgi:hypothetical protein